MKKTLSILTAAAMIFASAGSVMAAGESDCTQCKGYNIPNITCPLEQGQTMCAFDYDDPAPGNCPTPTSVYQISNLGRAVFDLCSCPTACKIIEGNILGVQIEILTPGVYFAYDPNINPDVNVNGALGAHDGTDTLRFSLFPKAKLESACAANNFDRYFTDLKYYNANGALVSRLSSSCGTVPAAPLDMRAKKLIVDKPGGYRVNATDVRAKDCQMWIDMPRMIFSEAEFSAAKAGSEVKVRISAFTEAPNGESPVDTSNNIDTLNSLNVIDDPATPAVEVLSVDNEWLLFAKYLCPDCVTPCGCDFVVAKLCCETGPYGLLFPYFAPDTDDSYFWNGIVVSNMSMKDTTATILIYEQDGDVGKAKVDIPANGVFNSLLRDIPNVTISKKGKGDTAGTIGNSKSYVWVCSEGRVSGFAMLSDQTGSGESMGYLPTSYWRPEDLNSILNCKTALAD